MVLKYVTSFTSVVCLYVKEKKFTDIQLTLKLNLETIEHVNGFCTFVTTSNRYIKNMTYF